jgi:uncharacterized protein
VPLKTVHGFGQPADGVVVAAPDYVRTRSAYFDEVTLRGAHVVLEPLRAADTAALFTALDDEEVHRHLTHPRPAGVADMAVIVQRALDRKAAGTFVPFTIRDAATGEVLGTTSFYDINPDLESIAIGATQVARARWRTAVNTEAKLLLMTYAFETLGAGRVEWHTDIRNERSQAAIERLGATREGVFRRHKRRGDGTWRDSVMYAMVADDWPAAKQRLAERLTTGHTELHVAGHH